MKDKTSLKLPIILMTAPIAGIVVAFILYAVTNALAAGTTPPPTDSELFGATPTWVSSVNVLLFLVGGVCVMAFMPCLIIGLVILVQRLDRRKAGAHTAQPPRQWEDLQ